LARARGRIPSAETGAGRATACARQGRQTRTRPAVPPARPPETATTHGPGRGRAPCILSSPPIPCCTYADAARHYFLGRIASHHSALRAPVHRGPRRRRTYYAACPRASASAATAKPAPPAPATKTGLRGAVPASNATNKGIDQDLCVVCLARRSLVKIGMHACASAIAPKQSVEHHVRGRPRGTLTYVSAR
jgi:hypothetical protein